jgi:hypothetical protein
MRYTEVINFYGIKINNEPVRDCVDAFFSLAATHHQLFLQSVIWTHREMHRARRDAYVFKFKDLIRLHGIFSGRDDPSQCGLHLRESWRGSDFPHPDIFERMPDDKNFEPNDDLPADSIYLSDLVTCLPVRLAS